MQNVLHSWSGDVGQKRAGVLGDTRSVGGRHLGHAQPCLHCAGFSLRQISDGFGHARCPGMHVRWELKLIISVPAAVHVVPLGQSPFPGRSVPHDVQYQPRNYLVHTMPCLNVAAFRGFRLSKF